MLACSFYVLSWNKFFIRTRAGDLTYNPVQILSGFSEFFSSLYTNPGSFSLQQVLPGTESSITPKWSKRSSQRAIKSLKPSKASGPDRFSGLCYKTFSTLLAPHFANYFKALKHGSLPSIDALRAHISMVPQKARGCLWTLGLPSNIPPEREPEDSG